MYLQAKENHIYTHQYKCQEQVPVQMNFALITHRKALEMLTRNKGKGQKDSTPSSEGYIKNGQKNKKHFNQGTK